MISANATLPDVIKELASLQRKVEAMELAKQAGRNRTGERAVPSSSTDLISGDIAGDYLYDGFDRLRLDVIDDSGTLEWRITTGTAV